MDAIIASSQSEGAHVIDHMVVAWPHDRSGGQAAAVALCGNYWQLFYWTMNVLPRHEPNVLQLSRDGN